MNSHRMSSAQPSRSTEHWGLVYSRLHINRASATNSGYETSLLRSSNHCLSDIKVESWIADIAWTLLSQMSSCWRSRPSKSCYRSTRLNCSPTCGSEAGTLACYSISTFPSFGRESDDSSFRTYDHHASIKDSKETMIINRMPLSQTMKVAGGPPLWPFRPLRHSLRSPCLCGELQR